MNYFSLFILLWIPYSWAKPIVKHPTVMYDIAIIGAGISGLYCGWRLIPDTKKIIILEQDNRVGGRIWSVPIPKIDAFKAEIGAMRFLSTHYLLMNLLQELQIPIQDFKHTYFKDNPLFVRDTHLQAQDVYQKKAPLPYKISKQYQG
ncbi:MAG: FAD/NAD(P)-binding protein, partial [Candidatus Babeliales bacterium]